ncbi:MAG: tetraacyldisaccharide 4'-kinase [Acidobacteria bacterium]|nr:tetraacyldisaccharide 4'-kinase [Acidobacteriota bacterium]
MKRPLLLPLVPLYAAGVALREMRLEHGWEKVRILWYPVISVGNLSTGGSGKTPLVIALAQLLGREGFRVDVLSRGYGRESREAARVRSDGSAEQFGDEPLLIARKAGVPVWVAAERYEAGQSADHDFIQSGGELSGDPAPLVHLLDDGFQHRQLFRDIDVLLLNREDWDDHLLPAGNLREPLESLERASVLAIPADDREFEEKLREWGWTGPVWRVRRRMNVPQVDGPVAAFCGIARSEQFFAGMEARGLRLAWKKAFADHHRYTKSDVDRLIESARKAGAGTFITTEKDQVRLGALVNAFRNDLRTAELTVEFDDEKSVAAWLKNRLAETHMAQAHRKTMENQPAS